MQVVLSLMLYTDKYYVDPLSCSMASGTKYGILMLHVQERFAELHNATCAPHLQSTSKQVWALWMP